MTVSLSLSPRMEAKSRTDPSFCESNGRGWRRRTVSGMRTTERASGSAKRGEARASAAPFSAPAARRTLIEEVVLVLSLSLLAAAAYSILSYTAAPVNVHVTATVISTSPRLASQLIDVAFALPPAWLVVYLVRRNGESLRSIGLGLDEPGRDLVRGAVLAAVAAAVGATALLRGTYHLYQGWGGFAGNLALGLFFGWLFTRWRRAWPLVIAHTLVDVGAGVLYIAFRSKLPGLLGA